ncbi:hypothetical protein O0I10_007711 [Lichtheimia ornata]|uniref:Centromere protein O n=1 Tax=Lichtheimia ornata TaxID=688661 RepID=A0AAD7UZR6_9FUNG|nr:uncharacterized protein O0I10_007711 [Lichtheimia ornata]KAJ8656634.1 hypothetical protein O0I10_007711 [Lichtheimia ornata]
MLEDDDTFLPTPQDRLKADISDLRHRLNKAREEKQRLEREIMEERIGYIAATRFSEEIRDTTRYKASQMTQIQQQILEQWMAVSSARCVQEIVGYYRLAGRTTFQFQGNTGIRLETYYKAKYYEPYYLLLSNPASMKYNSISVAQHTIPFFIPVQEMVDTFLPHDMEALLRILHVFLLAYVSRREQVEELGVYCKERASFVGISAERKAKDHIILAEKIDVEQDKEDKDNNNTTIRVELIYDDLTSEYPTKVKTSIPSLIQTTYDTKEIETKFQTYKLLDAYKTIFSA